MDGEIVVAEDEPGAGKDSGGGCVRNGFIDEGHGEESMSSGGQRSGTARNGDLPGATESAWCVRGDPWAGVGDVVVQGTSVFGCEELPWQRAGWPRELGECF